MHGSMKKFVTTHGHAWARCLGLTKKFVTTVTPGGRAQWVGTTSRGPTGGRVPSWGNLITN